MQKPRNLSRRNFATLLAASSAAGPALMAQQPAAQPAQQQRRGTLPEVPPFQAPLEFSRALVPARVEPFPLTQVRLLAGLYKDAEEWNRGYMQRLKEERLVRNFQVNAGLPPPPSLWAAGSRTPPAAPANCAGTSPVPSSPPPRNSTLPPA